MKVGDYVRTKNGKIGKLVNVEVYYVLGQNEKEHYVAVLFENDFIPSLVLKVFIKKSGSLIDILEVGDYVNGECVISVDSIEVYTRDGMYLNEDIKSIVTKEMYSSVEYKVGELDER